MIGFGIDNEEREPMKHGWYLRSDGYMTSECSYQRIEAMKGNRALDNHGKLVFVKYTGDEEIDSRVYVPHPGTCEQVLSDCDDGLLPPFTAHCSACGAEWGFTPKFCHNCGAKCTGTRDERKAVER